MRLLGCFMLCNHEWMLDDTRNDPKGDVQLGMSLTDFNNTMYWGTWAESDPGQTSWGGSGYDRYFQDHLIVYGGNRERIFIFDNRSVLVAITESIEEAEKLILRARAASSSIQNPTS